KSAFASELVRFWLLSGPSRLRRLASADLPHEVVDLLAIFDQMLATFAGSNVIGARDLPWWLIRWNSVVDTTLSLAAAWRATFPRRFSLASTTCRALSPLLHPQTSISVISACACAPRAKRGDRRHGFRSGSAIVARQPVRRRARSARAR